MEQTNRWVVAAMMASCAVGLGGCLGDGDVVFEDEVTGEMQGALSSQNALTENALSSNKLSSNKLSSNKLSSNKLSSNSLAFNTAPNWDVGGGVQGETTAAGKELLRYLAKCALPAGMNLVNGTDTYPGLLGLAPTWETTALSTADQQKISACLGAHTNKFGTSVSISVRWNNTYTADEANYNDADAAFYGNYFDGTGIYVCKLPQHGNFMNSPDKNLRVCDDSNADCGFIKTSNDCGVMCSSTVQSNNRNVYSNCKPVIGSGLNYPFAVNVYLRSS